MNSTVIADRLTKRITKEVPEARVAIFGPPPVAGLGSGGGFKFIVEDRGENDLKKLAKTRPKSSSRSFGQPRWSHRA